MKYSKTGKHPGIPVRNADFGFADIPKYWFNRDPLFTHYFTGLSTLFPEGEAFFVRSVRKLRARVRGNEELDSRIGAFIGQEAMHSREHEAFHVSAQKHGLDPKSLEAWTGKILGFMERNFSEKSQLLITTALEHYTAVLVVEMMKDIHEMMDDKNVRDLWLWHSIEETEHKSVAYDMYEYLYGKGWTSYFSRVSMYVLSLSTITVVSLVYAFVLMKRDGQLLNMNSYRRFLPFALRSYVRFAPKFLAYLRPGFHPDDYNDDMLVDKTKKMIGIS